MSFFILKISGEYFILCLNKEDNTITVEAIDTRKIESIFVIMLDKITKTSNFKICSEFLSKGYLENSLSTCEYIIIGFGMHKKETKLKQRLLN